MLKTKTIMKKIILIAIALLSLSSCSKKGITMEVTEATLHHGDTYQIEAESKSPITYASADNYHAGVTDAGLVTAMFVGETDIQLQNDEEEKFFHVTVEPKYHLYPEPDITFGESTTSVIAKYGDPDKDTGEAMLFKNYFLGGFNLLVTYSGNNLVTGYGVTIPLIFTDMILDFFDERYFFVGIEDDMFFYCNVLPPDTPKMGIVISLYEIDFWVALYFPVTDQKNISLPVNYMTKIKSLL